MSIYWYLRYRIRLCRIYPDRYRDFFKLIFAQACKSFLEIGTHNGLRARQMIETARVRHPASVIRYWGVDLFEELTPEMRAREYALPPPSLAEVQRRLDRTGAVIQLFKGNSKVVLPQIKARIGPVDFIFIDGGHAFETIESDWNNVCELAGPNTVVLFDDYFYNDEKELVGVGCQKLISELDPGQYDVELMPQIDTFKKEWGVLKTQMVKVTRRK